MNQDKAYDHFDAAIRYYYDNNDPDSAIDSLRRAISLMPENSEFYSALGQILYEQGTSDEAESLFQQAIALNYEDQRALRSLATVHQERGEDEDALYYYHRFLDVTKDPDPDVFFNLGVLLHTRSEYEAALENYDRSADANPDDPVVYENRGKALADLGRFEEAVTDLKHSLDLNPAEARTHWALAGVMETLGDLPGAQMHYESALARDASNPEIRIDLAWVSSEQKNYDDAITHSQIAMKIYEEERNTEGIARAAWSLGWEFYRAGKIDESIRASKKALDSDPKLAPVRFNLGLALLANGKVRDARKQYEEGIKFLDDINDLQIHAINDLREAIGKSPKLPGAASILKSLESEYQSRRPTPTRPAR